MSEINTLTATVARLSGRKPSMVEVGNHFIPLDTVMRLQYFEPRHGEMGGYNVYLTGGMELVLSVAEGELLISHYELSSIKSESGKTPTTDE